MNHTLNFQLMFLGIFAVANNLKALGKFIHISNGLTDKEQFKLSFNATLASFIAMLLALFCGEAVLNFLGLSMDSFRLSGGIILVLLGIDMIQVREAVAEDKAATSGERNHNYSSVISTAIIPIAIPFTTGAGTFSTITLFAHEIGHNWRLYGQLLAAIILQAIIIFLVFNYSRYLVKLMGHTGMNVLIRVVGLFTLALGVQFIAMGIGGLFPILSID